MNIRVMECLTVLDQSVKAIVIVLAFWNHI